jgi:hypothetical protein
MVGVLRNRGLALMSAPTTPTISNDSPGGSSRQDSTQPSSLDSVASGQESVLKLEVQDEQSAGGTGGVGEEATVEDEEDTEGMDIKARALTNLLKTSSVHNLSNPVISLKPLILTSCRFLWRLWPKK